MPGSGDVAPRPPRAVQPGPGQESVWDYPRQPRLEPTSRRARVLLSGVTIADTRRAVRALETSHPPTYYVPPEDVLREYLETAPGIGSVCEWKGAAHYFTVIAGSRRAHRAAWSYAEPTPPFRALKDHVAFYVSQIDACFVDDEQARPQPGGFYGGWVTPHVVGPFKGAPGSEGW